MVSGCSLSDKHQTAPKGFPNPQGTMPISYYVICLVSNVMLMSLYAVQVYSPHQTCIVNGKNITHHYDLAFRLGFAILFADFFNLNVLSLFSTDSGDRTRHSSGFNRK